MARRKRQSEKLTRYKKYNTMLGGKYKPPKKAVEEFHRPVYGFGKKPVYGMEKKDCKDCIHDSKQWHEDPCDGCCGGDAFERRKE